MGISGVVFGHVYLFNSWLVVQQSGEILFNPFEKMVILGQVLDLLRNFSTVQ